MTDSVHPWARPLDRHGPTPVYRQVMDVVREAVGGGRLRPGGRIPSATDLARTLDVSRPTVVRAYRQLEREGVIVSQVGRGSFVAPARSEAPASGSASGSASGPVLAGSPPGPRPRWLGQLRRGHMTSLSHLMEATPPGTVDLRPGSPRTEELEAGLLPELAARAARDMAGRLGRYVFRGLPELVEALAARLRAAGHEVGADQILITNGAQDAIGLVSLWAAQQARSMVCETPTFWGVPLSFMGAGHWVSSVRRDGAELDAAGLESALRGRASVLYTCPDFHHPTGSCLAARARAAVASAASRHDTVVVVDDIFRDLRFAGTAAPSLYEQLPAGRRVLVGSLSKSFMPGLRVGWLVADPALLEPLADLKRFADLGGPALMQAMAALVLAEHYDGHLGRVRSAYRARVQAAATAIRRHMPKGVVFARPEGGFHLWIRMPCGCSSMQLYLEALTEGVAISPGPMHDLDGGYLDCFRISVAWAGPDELSRAIETLGRLAARQLERR